MSPRKQVALFTLGLAASLATSAVAAVSQVRSLNLPTAVVVNGVRLNPGEYTLIWEVTRSRTSVSFANETQRLATVPARLVAVKQKYARNTLVCGKDADGTCDLREIHFTGPGRAIVFHAAKARRHLSLNTPFTLDLITQRPDAPPTQPDISYRQRPTR